VAPAPTPLPTLRPNFPAGMNIACAGLLRSVYPSWTIRKPLNMKSPFKIGLVWNGVLRFARAWAMVAYSAWPYCTNSIPAEKKIAFIWKYPDVIGTRLVRSS
jgi:hypothetical protein